VQAPGQVRSLGILALLFLCACLPGTRDPLLERTLSRLEKVRMVNLKSGSLQELNWLPLREGDLLAGRDLVLTAVGSRLALKIPGRSSPLQVRGYLPLSTLKLASGQKVQALPIRGQAWWASPGLRGWLAGEVPLPLEWEPSRGGWGFAGRQAFRQGTGESGVEVTLVFPDSPADRLGLRPGDVVVAGPGGRVRDPEDLVVGLQGRQEATLYVSRWPLIWRGTIQVGPGAESTGIRKRGDGT
jgi:hypothetical protein